MRSKLKVTVFISFIILLSFSLVKAQELSKFQSEVIKAAESLEKELTALSDKIWSYAELGMEEFKSTKLVIDYLRKKGWKIEEKAAGMPTGFVASWGSGSPVLGFNCELDALPGLSQKSSSKKEPVVEGAPGHGCGHNLLGVGSIGAALAMREVMEKNALKGTLKIFGNPAEELCIGKPYFAEKGLYDRIDAFIDWHPGATNQVNATQCNAYFNVKFKFYGRTGHGNVPWTARSALDAAVLQAVMTEFLREHIVAGDAKAATTINYTFTNVGPHYPNVISDYTEAWYVGRLPSEEVLQDSVRRLILAGEAAAKATETKVETMWISATPVRIPNMTLARIMDKNLRAIGPVKFTPEEHKYNFEIQKSNNVKEIPLSEKIEMIAEGWGGVSDNAVMSWKAPWVSVNTVTRPIGPFSHHWGAVATGSTSIGKKGMMLAVKVMASTGIELLEKPQILNEAKEEWLKRLAGRTYKPLYHAGTPVPFDINKSEMAKYRHMMEKFYIE